VRARLALMAAATTSMVVIAFVVPLGLAVRTIAANEALHDADVQARSLAAAIATVTDGAVLADLIRSANATSVGPLSVFMPGGQVLGAPATVDGDVTAARMGRAFTTFSDAGARVFVPVVIAGAGTAVIEVAVPESRLHRGVATAWAILGAAGLALVLLAVFVADRIARGMVSPALALAQAARDVARGELGTRVTPDGPPEMAEVGRAFNLLVARIGDLLAAEREAAADLSHRLRTPLTALRLDVDRMPAGPESDRLAAGMVAMERAVTGVIGRMRRRTRDGGRPSTDLVAAVHDRIGFWTELAREQGRELQVSIDRGPAAVALEKDEVETLVDELLTNVFAHTADTTPCRVLVEVPQPDRVRLVVEDDGPGFARELVGRGESQAESSGLGLDIVSRIAAGAGGSLDVTHSRSGGARVEVVLRVSR